MRLIEVEEIKIGFKRDELFALVMLVNEDIKENAVRLFPYYSRETKAVNFDRLMGWLMQENHCGKKIKMLKELSEYSMYQNIYGSLEFSIKQLFDQYIEELETKK